MPAVAHILSRDEVLKLYEEGMNPSSIASKLHVAARRVRALLTAEGLLQAKNALHKCDACGDQLSGHGAIRYCDECVPDSRFANIMGKYGITKRDYDKMLAEQNGLCALCNRLPTHVDHDHGTGVVRGLLCTWCNSSLGRIDDDSTWVDRAVNYSKRGQN